MSSDMNKQLNIAAAEVLGLEIAKDYECNPQYAVNYKMQPSDGVMIVVDRSRVKPFDLSDHNCLKLVIEHFRIDVDYHCNSEKWSAETTDYATAFQLAEDKSRDKAILKCVAKCLCKCLEIEEEL